MDKQLIIARGGPGTGKSTFLQKNYPEAFICSANFFFTDSKGNYKFFPKGLEHSHVYSQNAFKAALQNNVPLIAIDNTNIKLWEFEAYLDMAKDYGYTVSVFRMEVNDFEAAAKRNIHGVPIDKAMRMQKEIEDYPGEKFVNTD